MANIETARKAIAVSARASARRGCRGALRALIAMPAVIGSLMLVLLVFGWMDRRWEGLVVLGWLASPLAVFTRAGERAVVRLGCGFRLPGTPLAELLAPAWIAALARAGIAEGEVDLYVQRASVPNAYAAGARSVAVTSGVSADRLAGRLTDDQLSALLAHELGHHARGGTRCGLITVWLSAPWRCVVRLVVGLSLAFAGRQSRRFLAVLIMAAVVVAVVSAVQQHQELVASVLVTLVVVGVACPLSEAALSRRDEISADRFAAHLGYGSALAAALRQLEHGQQRRRGLLERALARHPSTDLRVKLLYVAAAR